MFDYDGRASEQPVMWLAGASMPEMRKSNSSPNGGVYISMSYLGPDKVRELFRVWSNAVQIADLIWLLAR